MPLIRKLIINSTESLLSKFITYLIEEHNTDRKSADLSAFLLVIIVLFLKFNSNIHLSRQYNWDAKSKSPTQ